MAGAASVCAWVGEGVACFSKRRGVWELRTPHPAPVVTGPLSSISCKQ